MNDVNGVTIRTGDVVVVSDAFFKVDNGTYFVAHSPGDPSWCGYDYSLRRLNRNGSFSEGKSKVAFWPLEAFCSDREKNARALDWNRVNAKIEVIAFDRKTIADYFDKLGDEGLKSASRVLNEWGWGKHSGGYLRELRIGKFYKETAARIREEDAN